MLFRKAQISNGIEKDNNKGNSWPNFDLAHQNSVRIPMPDSFSVVYNRNVSHSMREKKTFNPMQLKHCIFVGKSHFEFEHHCIVVRHQISIPLNDMRHCFNGTVMVRMLTFDGWLSDPINLCLYCIPSYTMYFVRCVYI